MRRNSLVSRLGLFALLVSLAGCKQSVTVPAPTTNPTPTPSPPSQEVSIRVSAPQLTFTLNNNCDATVIVEAEVLPSTVSQAVVWDLSIRQQSGVVSFDPNGNKATLRINKDGVYKPKAMWSQDQSKSDEEIITALGNCGGTNPQPPPAFDLKIDPPTLNLASPACPSAGATGGNVSANASVSWRTSNRDVADVSSANGPLITVTAKSVGTATITGRSADGQEEEVKVTVACPTQPPPGPPQPPPGPPQPPPTVVVSVEVTPDTGECAVGGNFSFSAGVTTSDGKNTGVDWLISDTTIAKVVREVDNSVILECLKAGTVSVKATSKLDPSKSDTSSLRVNPAAVACTWTAPSGIQANGDLVLSTGQTVTATASCGAGLPFWYSSRPSDVEAKGTQNVGGWFVGNSATIRCISPGEATVTVQPSISQTSPTFSRRVVCQ